MSDGPCSSSRSWPSGRRRPPAWHAAGPAIRRASRRGSPSRAQRVAMSSCRATPSLRKPCGSGHSPNGPAARRWPPASWSGRAAHALWRRASRSVFSAMLARNQVRGCDQDARPRRARCSASLERAGPGRSGRTSPWRRSAPAGRRRRAPARTAKVDAAVRELGGERPVEGRGVTSGSLSRRRRRPPLAEAAPRSAAGGRLRRLPQPGTRGANSRTGRTAPTAKRRQGPTTARPCR